MSLLSYHHIKQNDSSAFYSVLFRGKLLGFLNKFKHDFIVDEKLKRIKNDTYKKDYVLKRMAP